MPAAPLTAMLRDPRILAFLAVWFGVNLLFGVGAITMPGMRRHGRLGSPYRRLPRRAAGLCAVRSGAPDLPMAAQDSPPITAR